MFLRSLYMLVQRHKFPLWSECSKQYEQVEDKSLVACNSEASEVLNSYHLKSVCCLGGENASKKSWILCYILEWGVNVLKWLLLPPEKKIILANECKSLYENILLYLSGRNFSSTNHIQKWKGTLKEGVYLYAYY